MLAIEVRIFLVSTSAGNFSSFLPPIAPGVTVVVAWPV